MLISMTFLLPDAVRLFVKRSAEQSQRKSERQPSTHLVDASAIHDGVSKTHVERKVVFHLPYCTNEGGERMRVAEFFFVEKFSDWPDRPIVWSLKDNACENIGVLIARERTCDIQVGSTPVPPL